MKVFVTSALFALAVLCLHGADAATDKIVCYYGSWAVYRPGAGKFDVEQIDPRLCTHLIYTFVGLSTDGSVRVLDGWNDLEDNWGKGAFKRFNRLRELSPGVKTMLAIGGWNEGSVTYSQVMANDALRANFVKSAVEIVKKYGFDGFDFDWEYPNQRGGEERDVANFARVLGELRAAFDNNGLLLSAAVASAEFSASQSYDIPALSKNLDFINVMTYDLHGVWDKMTGNNGPLYPSSKDETEIQKQLNVEACIDYWIKQGADPAKLVLGMGTYGRTFTLNNPANNGLMAPADQAGAAGPYTRQTGMLGFNEIVELQKQGGWTVVWDDEQKVPYMYKGNQWVGYDNEESIRIKTEYAKSRGLGGAMIWSVETDDFQGVSGSRFPLLYTINKALGRDIKPLPPTTAGPTTSTRPPQPSTPCPTEIPADALCQKEGYVRDPVDCSVFYYCTREQCGFNPVRFQCANGLVFDPETLSCNYASEVQC